MNNRANEIAQMMGYATMDDCLEAVGSGELILIKVPQSVRVSASKWLHEQATGVSDVDLAAVIQDIANSVDMAAELKRYPDDSDICDMALPEGWPSYCDKNQIE